MRLTARDNLSLGIIDSVIDEPLGGAHRNPDGASRAIEAWVTRELDELCGLEPDRLIEQRYERFRKLGSFAELTAADAAD